MKAKERHKCNLLEYLANPKKDFPTRLFMNSNILGLKDPTGIYKVFTLEELDEIEAEALELRRKKYKPEIAKVDKALLKLAKSGDTAAAKLCYQRFEDWSEKQRKELSGPGGKDLKWITEIIDPKEKKSEK